MRGYDYDIWVSQYGAGSSLMSLMGSSATAPNFASGAQMTMEVLTKAAKTVGAVAAKSAVPENPDLDGDGVLDEEELATLDAAILGLR